MAEHKLVYDKMIKYRQSTFANQEMSSRFKQIASLSDYNKEAIKELKGMTYRKCSKAIIEDEFSSNF